MSVVVGSLRVDLGMNSAQFETGAKRAGLTMRSLQVNTQALQGAASNFNLRGVTQQLSQVAQMTAATGQPIRALAVQLPDLALGFGPVGIAIGALAGLTLPLLTDALFGASEEMQTAEERAQALAAAIKAYQQAAEAAGMSSVELQEEFGAMAAEADRAFNALAQLARGEAEQALSATTTAISEQFGELAAAVAEVTDAVSSTERAWALGGLMDDLGIAEDRVAEAEALAQAIMDIGNADGPAEAAAAMQAALDALVAAKGPLEDMSGASADLAKRLAEGVVEAARLQAAIEVTGPALALAVSGASQFANKLAAAQGPAAGLLSTVQALANAAWDAATAMAIEDGPIGQSPALGGVRPSAEDIIGTTDQRAAIIRAQMQIDRYQASLRDVATAAGSGPGGAATAVDELASVSDTLNVILADAADPVQELQDQFQAFADGIDGIAQGAVDSFVDQLVNGFEDGMDGLKSLLENTLKELAAYLIKNQLQVNIGANVTGSAASGLGGVGSLAAMGPVGIGAAAFAVGYMIGDAIFGGNDPEPYAGSEQEAIDQEKAALIQQMHVLEGHSNYLKKQEIKAYDESNQALARKVQLLEEEAAIEAERQSLQMQLWELEGNTEAIRAAQLEQLDESNRALQEQIWAQQDLAAATDETTRAIEEAIAAISPDDYSTQFAYDRAIALAKNGYIPPDGTTPATSANPQQAQVEQTAAMNSQLSTLTSLMRESLTIMRQWNANGLPPEAV